MQFCEITSLTLDAVSMATNLQAWALFSTVAMAMASSFLAFGVRRVIFGYCVSTAW